MYVQLLAHSRIGRGNLDTSVLNLLPNLEALRIKQRSMQRFTSLPKQGNENIKYFISLYGNRTHTVTLTVAHLFHCALTAHYKRHYISNITLLVKDQNAKSQRKKLKLHSVLHSLPSILHFPIPHIPAFFTSILAY